MPDPQQQAVADVVICGGGLAGSTLARQLVRTMPGLSVVVVDRLSRPLPRAAFKVGESTTEIGTHYLTEVLGLTDYFREAHLAKLGFRFFFPGPSDRFEDRPEFGLVQFPALGSYNFDRGLLENDLRRFNEEAGVRLIEGARVQDVELAEDGGPHVAVVEREGGKETERIAARWLVDASGRRRLLQRKLELGRRQGRPYSAAWFRVPGRIDVSDFVSPEATGWHDRVPDRIRYWSTNHLMGRGYWVWLIPLSEGDTSIGIVALEELQPPSEFNTWERTLDWLSRNEPHLAAALEGVKRLDFQFIRQYSYSSRRVFSPDRWACVGEAGVFADPFYAPGTDMLGFANSAVTEMIRRDREDRLTPETVTWFNRSILGLNDGLMGNIQVIYELMDNPIVASAKVMWDTATAWGMLAPRMFGGTFVDEEKTARLHKITARSFFRTQRMQGLFRTWNEKSPRRGSFEFVDFLQIPVLRELRRRNLCPGKDIEELEADASANMQQLETLAQALFLLAVEDVMPEQLDNLPSPLWLNPWGASLDPSSWHSKRLFEPRSPPRPEELEKMRGEIRGLFSLNPSEAS